MPRSQSGSATQVRPAKAKHWTTVEARRVLARAETSGLSLARFAAREGLNAKRLYWWRKELDARATAGKPVFVEVKPSHGAAIEVVSRSGHVVRVPDEFREDTLVRVLAALEERAPRC